MWIPPASALAGRRNSEAWSASGRNGRESRHVSIARSFTSFSDQIQYAGEFQNGNQTDSDVPPRNLRACALAAVRNAKRGRAHDTRERMNRRCRSNPLLRPTRLHPMYSCRKAASPAWVTRALCAHELRDPQHARSPSFDQAERRARTRQPAPETTARGWTLVCRVSGVAGLSVQDVVDAVRRLCARRTTLRTTPLAARVRSRSSTPTTIRRPLLT